MAMVVGCVVVVSIVAAVWPGEKEPEYRGRNLSEWLRVHGEFSPDGTRVADAVRQMGTNAVPCVLRWINREPSWWVRVVGWVEALPPRLSRPLTRSRMWSRLRESRDEAFDRAGICIYLLGGEARSAIPALTGVVSRSRDPYRVSRAVLNLRFIGEEGVPALMGCLRDSRASVHIAAAYHLGELGKRARPATEELLATLRDPDPRVREIATNTVRRIAPEVLARDDGQGGGHAGVER